MDWVETRWTGVQARGMRQTKRTDIPTLPRLTRTPSMDPPEGHGFESGLRHCPIFKGISNFDSPLI
jgi:hypothetical protein